MTDPKPLDRGVFCRGELGSVLEVGFFLGDDRPDNRADLQTDATVNTGGEINPIPIGALGIFARAGVDAGNGASFHAIRNAFTDLGDDSMSHGSRD